MKMKCVPDDFQVTELTTRVPTTGVFSLYELQKHSVGTLEALKILRGSWNLAPSQVSHAGLKDKHAATTQLISIKHGPRRDFDGPSFLLRHLGSTDRAVDAGDITGNHFRIVLRSMTEDQVQRVKQRLSGISASGFPNYFDNQRFGSMGASKEFVAAYWCKRDYEKATWLALAEYNKHDRSAERKDKAFLRDNWNNWLDCKANLQRSNRRSVITYLVDHPTKFRKAFALIDPNMRGLYLSAFQSAVWNRMLMHQLTAEADEAQTAKFNIDIGDTSLPFGMSPGNLADTQLPLPSARCKDLTAKERDLCDSALQPYGLTLSEMKISFPRDKWFSRSRRDAFVKAGDLMSSSHSDEIHAGRKKLTMMFDLPRGCYATMLIKSITGEADSLNEDSDIADADIENAEIATAEESE